MRVFGPYCVFQQNSKCAATLRRCSWNTSALSLNQVEEEIGMAPPRAYHFAKKSAAAVCYSAYCCASPCQRRLSSMFSTCTNFRMDLCCVPCVLTCAWLKYTRSSGRLRHTKLPRISRRRTPKFSSQLWATVHTTTGHTRG